MKKNKFIFTSQIDDKDFSFLNEQIFEDDFSIYPLLRFKPMFNEKNKASLALSIKQSDTLCITSKQALFMLSALFDVKCCMVKKKIVTSGKKISDLLRDNHHLESIYAEKRQGQKGVIDCVDLNIESIGKVLYVCSDLAERCLEIYLENKKVVYERINIYQTKNNINSIKNLIQLLNSNESHASKTIIFSSPSAVDVFVNKVKPNLLKNKMDVYQYISFGESTYARCKGFNLNCYFDKKIKNYIDLIQSYKLSL